MFFKKLDNKPRFSLTIEMCVSPDTSPGRICPQKTLSFSSNGPAPTSVLMFNVIDQSVDKRI